MQQENNLSDVYNLRNGSKPQPEDEQLDTRPESYRAFRTDPQARPSNALLDLWFESGNQRAISYSHLYDVQFDRSTGLVLAFSEHEVVVEGHCLDQLYRDLKRHRVVYIWEASEQDSNLATDSQPLVTGITVRSRQHAM